jgi:hypothetical protein
MWSPTWRWGGMIVGSYLTMQGGNIIIAQIPNPVLVSNFLLTTRLFNFAR